MKASDIDWPFLAKGTLIPGVTAIVFAIVLAASYVYHRAQEQQFDITSSNHGAVYSDYDQLVIRKRTIDRYHRRYEKFHELGFVGRESRLDWIETFRTVAAQLQLTHATYAIEPQINVITPSQSGTDDAGPKVHASKLELEIGLLHDLDLLRFFDRVQAMVPGLVKVDGCRLTRQNSGAASDINIVANCSVAIFSVITSDVLARERGR